MLFNRKSFGFDFTIFGGIQFVVLTIIAMLVFPGGTIQDPMATHYLFLENFFSDLGRTQDFDGNSNLYSMCLFSVALCILGLSVISLFITVPSIFKKQSISLRGMTFIGIVAGVFFIGVAFTPWDIFFEAHIFFVRFGFRLLLIACILMGINIYKTNYFPSGYAYLIFAISLILFFYILLLIYGPRAGESQESLMLQVAGQKIIVYLLISGIITLAIGAKNVQKRMENFKFKNEEN